MAAAVATACTTGPLPTLVPASRTALPSHIRVQFSELGVTKVRDVPLEDYVVATSLSELTPSGDRAIGERMLEVQAIISRTYAVSHMGRHAKEGFDLCATTHCQVFDPNRPGVSAWTTAAIAAAAHTERTVLLYGGQPAEALYHADCGGQTSSAASVWGGTDRQYLISRIDTDVPASVHTRWQYRVRREAVADALAAYPAAAFSGSLQSIEIASRDEGGRATKIRIAGTDIRGGTVIVRAEDFRSALSRAFGAQTIRSTRFDLRQDAGWYTFAGQGYGHGVGLCQAGAFARIRAGASARDVLQYYYPGTSLQDPRTTCTH
jgi:stage II sporulation protein D